MKQLERDPLAAGHCGEVSGTLVDRESTAKGY